MNSFPASATALSDRIRAFEKYVCSLSGRVHTVVKSDQLTLELCRGRNDKWVLLARKGGGQFNLSSASLQIKIECIPLLPQLLAKMDSSQRQLTDAMNEACESFDKLFPDIKPEQGGEE